MGTGWEKIKEVAKASPLLDKVTEAELVDDKGNEMRTPPEEPSAPQPSAPGWGGG